MTLEMVDCAILKDASPLCYNRSVCVTDTCDVTLEVLERTILKVLQWVCLCNGYQRDIRDD